MKTERNKILKATHPLYLPLLLLPAGATSLPQLSFAKVVAISHHNNFNRLNATLVDFGCGLPFSAANGHMWLNLSQVTPGKSE